MGREIKFRAWDGGDMYDIGRLDIPWEYDNIKIMQFTGILDTNKREIYEGDIVKASIYSDEPDSILEVKCEKGCFVIDYKDSDSDVVPLGWFVGRIEVIGNIHETPNLLT